MPKSRLKRQVAIDAYIAGILDGESCFTFGAPTYTQCCPKITINITSEKIVDFLVIHAGGKKRVGITLDGSRWGNRRPTWIWTILGQEMCDLIERVYPYMIIKKKQASAIWQLKTVRIWAGENRPGVLGWAPKNPNMIKFYQGMKQTLTHLNQRGRFDYAGKD